MTITNPRSTTTPTRPDVQRVDRYQSAVERFRGADLLAGLFGALTALGTLVFLAATIAAGAANLPLQIDQLDATGALVDLDVGGVFVAFGVLAVSFFVGGWAAGRIARYDGGLNGALTALWMLAAAAGFAVLGSWLGQEYNAFAAADLPDWVSQWDTAGVDLDRILVGVAAILIAVLAGAIGGMLGDNYHRKADAAVTGDDGGVIA